MERLPFDLAAYVLLTGLGGTSLTFLILEVIDLRARRQQEQAANEQVQQPAELPPSTPPHDQSENAPERVKPHKPSEARQRLQRLLDAGVQLQQNASVYPGLSMGLGPETRQADVDAWEAEVAAELFERPRDLALFRYERPKSPLIAFGSLANVGNPLKDRLRQRIHQLEVLVRQTR